MPTGDNSAADPASEMAIVDTFTKLIFGEEEHFDQGELLIIQTLRLVDASVSRDSHRDMGQYLRALGVAEMIGLVGRVQAQMAGPVQLGSRRAGSSVLDRRAH